MLEAQDEAGGGAKRRRYGNGFDDDLPVTMHVGVGPGGAVAPGGGMAFPLTLSPGSGYPPVAADPLAAALARSGVAAAGMPHVTVNVTPAAAVAAPVAAAAPAAAVTPAGGSSTEVLLGLLQASLANGSSGAAAAASAPPPASAHRGLEGLLQALAPRLGLSNAAGGGGNISINVSSLASAGAGAGVNLNLDGALVQQLLPTLLSQLNNNGSNGSSNNQNSNSGITIHASGPAPLPLSPFAADAPPSPCRAQIVSTSRPQPLGTSTAAATAAALDLSRASSSIQLGPFAPNFSRTSSPPAAAAVTTDATVPRSPNHQHPASAWQPVVPAAAPRPVKSDPSAPPKTSDNSDTLSHRHHFHPTSSNGRPQPDGQTSAQTHGPPSDASATCSNGSVVSRFLASVLRSIPEGATVDCVVPCKDSGLMGYTWTPAPPASASNAPSGSGGAPEQERGREQQQQGRPGAGVWIQGACRSLGTYTTAEDALTACQACMAMLLDFKESLMAPNGCRNAAAPNAVASASASSETGMAAAQAGSSGGGAAAAAPAAAAPPGDRRDAQNANGHPSLARRSSFLLPSPGRVDSGEPATANTAAATAANLADPFARLSACEQQQQQQQHLQALEASRPCSNDGSVGAARNAPPAAAAPAATMDEQLAADTLSLMLRRHQGGPPPRQPSAHAANAQQPPQQQQQHQAPNSALALQQPAAARAEGLQLGHTLQQQQQQQVSFRRASDQPRTVGGSANSAFVPAAPRGTDQGPLHVMHPQQQQVVINAVPRTAVPTSALVSAHDGNRAEGRAAQGFTFSRQPPPREAGCNGEEERPRQRLRVSGPTMGEAQVQQQQQQQPLQVQLQGTNIMLDLQALANKSHGRLTMADLVRAAGALSMVNV